MSNRPAPRTSSRLAFPLLSLLALAPLLSLEPNVARAGTPPPAGTAEKLLYTTYFYTAAEAIVHGYEDDTHVRIVSLSNKGTIYSGVVGRGKTVLVPTGQGVFGFLADKKASILVGTPSSCTAVGYFVKNREGSFLSDQFYAELPSSVSATGAKVVLFAHADTSVTVTDMTGDKLVWKGKIAAGKWHTLESGQLQNLGSHVLELRADQRAITVEVYYDEGFVVPSKDGRASGREFVAYVGDITEGVNDLQLISYHAPAAVKVEDLENGKTIWAGTVERGKIEAISLTRRYVKVTSDREISVGVGPFKHYAAGYAEHHFSMGAEGTGIENDFLVTTPGELWLFSYFADSDVTVTDQRTGKPVWKGTLGAGHVQGLTPGFGFFHVKSTRGISVMGGSSACGGEYSPAAGLFAVDEALFKVVQEIQEQRRQRAEASGEAYTPAKAAAPLTDDEMKAASEAVKKKTGRSAAYTPAEIQERVNTMMAH